jgi:cytochrome c peroxidase
LNPLAIGAIAFSAPALSQAGGPPAPTAAQVGQALFFDPTLSTPPGMSCSTCHSPQAGFAYPISGINQALGPVPGAFPGRFGNRKPPQISYVALLPKGPPTFNPLAQTYQGGFFFDGRANDLVSQAAGPFQNPNEMNDLVNNIGSPALVVQKVSCGPSAGIFKQVYGAAVFTQPTSQVFLQVCSAIAAFEASPAMSPFSSQYDAYLAGKTTLSASAMHGLQLFTGTTNGRPGGPAYAKNANCSVCHALSSNLATGPDLFSVSTFHNLGVPRNPSNPFYGQTNAFADPVGVNALGSAYIDYGLGANFYTARGLPAGNVGAGSNGKGDFLNVNGMFKTPTLRNVDYRPGPGFVKDYDHNGVFKSLKQVVHFYNTRNLTTFPGEVIDFTRPNPYAGLKGTPLWPAPEYPNPATLVNPTGSQGAFTSFLGNLGLADQDENDIVAFLQTLTDAPFQVHP